MTASEIKARLRRTPTEGFSYAVADRFILFTAAEARALRLAPRAVTARPKRRVITADERATIARMLEAGVSVSDIAAHLAMKVRTLQQLLARQKARA